MALFRRARPSGSELFPGFDDIAEIGLGRLATVYRAREIDTNRLVALKLLNVRDASPRAVESFERESLALGAVSSHPNIVTLLRSFSAADGRPVLVLELCRGAISDGMPDGAGLPVDQVVSVGIKIAGALETAHRAGILHRDVKPQNILITEFGEPALADFGVAMLQASSQTTAGLFDFTTLHAAPELLEGGAASAATDVYELASSLYQLISGRSAFRAYDGESPASVILRILRDPVQPLGHAHVPPQLSDVLVSAMSKDKESRPPTAAEFAAQLAAVEDAEGCPRTRFVIRDADGSPSELPPVADVPLRRGAAGTPAIEASRRHVEVAAPEPTPEPVFVPVAGRHAVRIDEDEHVDDLGLEQLAEASTQSAPSQAPSEQPAVRYPIPPAVSEPVSPPAGAVPTWSVRTAAPAEAPVGDLRHDSHRARADRDRRSRRATRR